MSVSGEEKQPFNRQKPPARISVSAANAWEGKGERRDGKMVRQRGEVEIEEKRRDGEMVRQRRGGDKEKKEGGEEGQGDGETKRGGGDTEKKKGGRGGMGRW